MNIKSKTDLYYIYSYHTHWERDQNDNYCFSRDILQMKAKETLDLSQNMLEVHLIALTSSPYYAQHTHGMVERLSSLFSPLEQELDILIYIVTNIFVAKPIRPSLIF